MRRILLRILLVVACLTIVLAVWIFAGEQLSSCLDRFATVQLAALPLQPLTAYEGEEGTHHGGSFEIGSKAMSSETRDFMAYPLHLLPDAENQLVLAANGKSFISAPCRLVRVMTLVASSMNSRPGPATKSHSLCAAACSVGRLRWSSIS